MMKKILYLLGLAICTADASGQSASWIWYPGDYDIWLSNQVQNRRTDRGSFFPVFWKVDAHYPLMDFHKDVNLAAAETINIRVEGKYNVKLDGTLLEGSPSSLLIPAGKHRINLKVFCQEAVPAIFIRGNTIISDSSWLLTYEDKEWIDESGKASDISATNWLNADSWNFREPEVKPSAFKLPVKEIPAVTGRITGNEQLLDFRTETFGYLKLHGVRGSGNLSLFYGESREEALSERGAVTLDRLRFDNAGGIDSILPLSKAFRFVNMKKDNSLQIDSISTLYEYADLKDIGSFECADTLINRIYNVAVYTLHLNSREFFIDGIKRDRWVWSGDAYQSYLMNYYLMNDWSTVRRTSNALRGKDPVSSHINTIMDYSFYWFLGIYDYYLYSGDARFLRQSYPRMKTLMDYCLSRRNADGLMEGMTGDWIFIDWAAGLSKKGAVSFEQLLLCRSLETMAVCAGLSGNDADKQKYEALARDLKTRLFQIYWNPSKQALVHSYIDGKPTDHVTRYANMFGIFFDYFTDAQKKGIKKNVLLNKEVPGITTPYMRFYELEALCALGELPYVLSEMRSYWGDMLKLGATSFWEEYNPAKKGAEHYAMYGREFGKSLCHAWGASPIYLLGKYFLGVKPTSAGFETYSITPILGGLPWMKGTVPTAEGKVDIYCSKTQIRVKGTKGRGTLYFSSSSKPAATGVVSKGNNRYELSIEPGREYLVNYKSIQ